MYRSRSHTSCATLLCARTRDERRKQRWVRCYNIGLVGLDVELGAAPVAALGVVLDLVVGLHAEPVRDGARVSERRERKDQYLGHAGKDSYRATSSNSSNSSKGSSGSSGSSGGGGGGGSSGDAGFTLACDVGFRWASLSRRCACAMLGRTRAETDEKGLGSNVRRKDARRSIASMQSTEAREASIGRSAFDGFVASILRWNARANDHRCLAATSIVSALSAHSIQPASTVEMNRSELGGSSLDPDRC